jgi:ABC-type sugar transport system permease subunit
LETRRGRKLRDNITAYLFLTPGLLIIFTFGIFPIFYAGYVSLFQWRIRQGEYRGLANFVNAMGDVAYVALALFSIGIDHLRHHDHSGYVPHCSGK